MIRAVIFDFDGVILESAVIKTKAFGEVVKGYPKEQADAFVAYHMTHMGVSRHVKFRYFIEEILHEEYTDEKEKKLADSFESIVYNQVMKCPFVPGAREFLEHNYEKYDLYIASGTPEEEMNRVVQGRKLEKYFKEIYGSPLKKTEIIDLILTKHGYSKEEALFVGDANTDMNAAAETGLSFVGRMTEENEEMFERIRYKIDNLLQIERVIEECQL